MGNEEDEIMRQSAVLLHLMHKTETQLQVHSPRGGRRMRAASKIMRFAGALMRSLHHSAEGAARADEGVVCVCV
jgi:hypothetical protein